MRIFPSIVRLKLPSLARLLGRDTLKAVGKRGGMLAAWVIIHSIIVRLARQDDGRAFDGSREANHTRSPECSSPNGNGDVVRMEVH